MKRGKESPYLGILHHMGLQYDEKAPGRKRAGRAKRSHLGITALPRPLPQVLPLCPENFSHSRVELLVFPFPRPVPGENNFPQPV